MEWTVNPHTLNYQLMDYQLRPGPRRSEPPISKVAPIRGKVAASMTKFAKMSPNEIAHFLRAEGIRGVPGSSMRCGMARYLQKMTGEDIFIDGNSVYLVSAGDFLTVSLAPVPSSVRYFIMQFDAEVFPMLIEEPGRRAATVEKAAKAAMPSSAKPFTLHDFLGYNVVKGQVDEIYAATLDKIAATPTVEFSAVAQKELALAGA